MENLVDPEWSFAAWCSSGSGDEPNPQGCVNPHGWGWLARSHIYSTPKEGLVYPIQKRRCRSHSVDVPLTETLSAGKEPPRSRERDIGPGGHPGSVAPLPTRCNGASLHRQLRPQVAPEGRTSLFPPNSLARKTPTVLTLTVAHPRPAQYSRRCPLPPPRVFSSTYLHLKGRD